MAPSFWRSIQSLCVPSRILRSVGGWALFAIAGAVVLFCPAAARADVYYINVYNVTFNGPCVGGGTCTETVVHGTGYYDPALNEAWDVSAPLTGSLNVMFGVYGTPAVCSAPGCLGTPVFYDPNADPTYNPIEISFGIPNFDAPVPTHLAPNGTLLFVPYMCGNDQPKCNQPGAFLGNGAVDVEASALEGESYYTSVDIGPDPLPEPSSLVLLTTGVMGLLARRGFWRGATRAR